MGKLWRKFVRNKRAIAPVLSELLLTVIVVAAMSIAASATYVITSSMRENINERVVVEDVWFNTADQAVNIYLYNSGQVDVNIHNVYVNHVLYSVSFRLGLQDEACLTLSPNWTQGEVYYIDIVTDRGNHIADYYKAA
jgi:hypothetical protein